MIRNLVLLTLLLSACAPKLVSSNPSQSAVMTQVAQAMGETTQTIPPPYFTFEEETYADQVSHSTGNVVTALDTFTAHNELLAADPSLVQDETWQAELQPILDELDHTVERVSNIDPVPDIFVDLNPKMLALGEAITTLVDDYSSYAFDGEDAKAELTQPNIDAVTLLLHEIAVQLREITFDAFSS